MIITISGTAGSGKSTVGKLLSKKLNYNYISIGKIKREIAKDLKINIEELNKLLEKDRRIEYKIDEFQKELGKKDNHIVDSRLGFYFIPHSFKIFLKADPKECAKRILNDKRPEERFVNLQEVIKEIIQRNKEDSKRYLELYGVDYLNEKNYDLVIDTTHKSPEEVVQEIIKAIKKRNT